MKGQKLTGWFPPEIKPVRVGVYETKDCDGHYFNYFDGKDWHYGWCSQSQAIHAYHAYGDDIMPASHYGNWRGLAQDPNE